MEEGGGAGGGEAADGPIKPLGLGLVAIAAACSR